MEIWLDFFEKGKTSFKSGDFEKALRLFTNALTECPSEYSACCAKILFCVGLTLYNLGCLHEALACWTTSHRVSRFEGEITNDSQAMRPEDIKYFYESQVKKYCSNCEFPDRYLGKTEKISLAVKIEVLWRRVAAVGLLDNLSDRQKRELLKSLPGPNDYIDFGPYRRGLSKILNGCPTKRLNFKPYCFCVDAKKCQECHEQKKQGQNCNYLTLN